MLPVKFSIQLPENRDRRLRLWAKLKGTTRAGLAAAIVQSRIEMNWAEIEKELDEIAKRRKVSREQLEEELLSADDD